MANNTIAARQIDCHAVGGAIVAGCLFVIRNIMLTAPRSSGNRMGAGFKMD